MKERIYHHSSDTLPYPHIFSNRDKCQAKHLTTAVSLESTAFITSSSRSLTAPEAAPPSHPTN